MMRGLNKRFFIKIPNEQWAISNMQKKIEGFANCQLPIANLQRITLSRSLQHLILMLSFMVLIFSCTEKKKKIDPKFDESQYERIDVNFYRGKTDGKIYIRTGELTMVKDSGNKLIYSFKEIK